MHQLFRQSFFILTFTLIFIPRILAAPYHSPISARSRTLPRSTEVNYAASRRPRNCSSRHSPHNDARSLTVPMPIAEGTYSIVQMDIGTPAQIFDIVVDLGSVGLWVEGQCKGSDCGNHTRLENNTSSSLLPIGKTFQIHYIPSNLTIDLEEVTDTVKVGGAVLNATALGVATQQLDAPELAQFAKVADGMMGLGPPSHNKSVPVLLESLVEKKFISAPTISLVYPPESHGNGSLVLGHPDSNLFNSSTSVVFNDTNKGDGQWVLDVTSSIDGKMLSNSSRKAVLTPGYPFVMIPATEDELLPFYPNASVLEGFLVVPCDTTVAIILSIGGKISLPIEPQSYIQSAPSPDNMCATTILVDPTNERRL